MKLHHQSIRSDMVLGILDDWTREEFLALVGIIISIFIAFAIYLLQKRLTDKQRVDHRLEIEDAVNKKLHAINYAKESRKVQLYNSKLINKRYFASNRRSIIWGYPYHGAALYGANFDGLEFIVSNEEWGGSKYQKVGVISYENILGIRPDGDGSFSGMIFYVKPKRLQKDKYSIAYDAFRYYKVVELGSEQAKKPLKNIVSDSLKKFLLNIRYNFYLRWKFYINKNRSGNNNG